MVNSRTQGVQQPTPAPFESLLQAHSPAVWRYVSSHVGPQDAEDVWSETFLAALRAYPHLPPDTQYEAWLITIARHKSIDAFRARSRLPVPLEELPPPSDTPNDFTEQAVQREEITAHVNALPHKQREAIRYRYGAELSYAEIAQITGQTPTAVRRSAADAVASLRRAYTQSESSLRNHRKQTEK